MIEALSRKIALAIHRKSSGEYNNDTVEVLQYGIECIINAIVPLFIIYIVAFFLGIFIYGFVWSLLFLILRNYMGGFHASSHIKCIILSTLMGILALCLIKILTLKLFIVKAILLLLSFLLFVIFGPNIQNDYDEAAIKSLLIIGIVLFLVLSGISLTLLYFKIKLGNVVLLSVMNAWIMWGIEKVAK